MKAILLSTVAVLTLILQNTVIADSGNATMPLYVFNKDDYVCDRINIDFTRCGPVDRSGKYRVVFLSPCDNGVQIWSGHQGKFQDTVVAFVGRWSDGKFDPVAKWEDARIFVRESCVNCDVPWRDIEAADAERSAMMNWPPSAEWPRTAPFWGYRLPASLRDCNVLECFLCPRPGWQRQICRTVKFTGTAPIQATTNIASTDVNAEVRMVGSQLTFVHDLIPGTPSSLFFVPRQPVISDDAVVMASNGTPSSLAWNCSGDVTITNLTPRLRVASRADDSTEAVLIVSVGGEVTLTSSYSRIRGSMVLPDGEQINFEGPTLNGCYVEWPAHCEHSGIFSITAEAVGSSIVTPIPTTYYELKNVDPAWSSGKKLRVIKIGDSCPPAESWGYGGTIAIDIPADGQCFGIVQSRLAKP